MDTQTIEEGNILDESNLSWEEYKLLHPVKPYEQSEKYGDYQYRVSCHWNNLYVKWQKLNNTTSPLNLT